MSENKNSAVEAGTVARRSAFRRLMNTHEFIVLMVLVALFVVFSIAAKRFLTIDNILSILNLAAIMFIMAVGEMLVIITGGIDLSVAAIMALGGIVSTSMIMNGLPWPLAVIVPILIGMVIGLVNGLMTAKVGVVDFIATLAMQLICHGITYTWTGGYPINYGLPDGFLFLGQGSVFGVPMLIIISLVVLVIFFILLHKCKFGSRLYAMGGNKEASRLSGVNVDRVKISAFVISGTLGGLAGVLMAARLGSGQPSAGATYLNYVIGGAILGGTSPSGGIGKIYGTFIGVIIFQTITNGLTHLQVNSYIQEIVRGAVILLALTINAMRERRQSR